MANHSSILPWEYINRGVWWATVHGITRVGHDLAVTSPFSSVQFSSVQSCPTLWDPIKCRTPGFPVHHQLLKLTQTHVHRVSDASTISSSVIPFSSHLHSFPLSSVSHHQWLFCLFNVPILLTRFTLSFSAVQVYVTEFYTLLSLVLPILLPTDHHPLKARNSVLFLYSQHLAVCHMASVL